MVVLQSDRIAIFLQPTSLAIWSANLMVKVYSIKASPFFLPTTSIALRIFPFQCLTMIPFSIQIILVFIAISVLIVMIPSCEIKLVCFI